MWLDLEDDSAQNLMHILDTLSKEKGRSLDFSNITILLYFAINDLYPIFWFKNCIEPMLRGKDVRRKKEQLYQTRNVVIFIL